MLNGPAKSDKNEKNFPHNWPECIFLDKKPKIFCDVAFLSEQRALISLGETFKLFVQQINKVRFFIYPNFRKNLLSSFFRTKQISKNIYNYPQFFYIVPFRTLNQAYNF